MLKGLNLRFDPVEDRLLLRLLVDEHDTAGEQRLHLTRRVCTAWRRDLQACVDASAEVPERLDAPARAALSAAHHQAMASMASVHRERAAASADDDRPQLVVGIACGRRKDDGRWAIRFDTQAGRAWTIFLTPQTLHGLVDLLTAQIRHAGGALEPMATEQAAPVVAGTLPLH